MGTSESISTGDVPPSALAFFLIITFAFTWGLVGVYIIFPDRAVSRFGEISGAHPFFFLATWSPAIAGFVLHQIYGGVTGLRSFLSRPGLWRRSPTWIAFVQIGLPLVFVAGSLIKGGPIFAPLPPKGAGPVIAVLFMMLFLGPIEQFGWPGVTQQPLQRHVAPIWAGGLSSDW